MKELVKLYDDYLKLLAEEIGELAAIAILRGWESSRVVEGRELRKKIEKAKRSLFKKETNY